MLSPSKQNIRIIFRSREEDIAVTYTIRSLAEHWQCSESKIYQMIRAGEVEAFRVGGGIRISEDSVHSYESDNHSILIFMVYALLVKTNLHLVLHSRPFYCFLVDPFLVFPYIEIRGTYDLSLLFSKGILQGQQNGHRRIYE